MAGWPGLRRTSAPATRSALTSSVQHHPLPFAVILFREPPAPQERLPTGERNDEVDHLRAVISFKIRLTRNRGGGGVGVVHREHIGAAAPHVFVRGEGTVGFGLEQFRSSSGIRQ